MTKYTLSETQLNAIYKNLWAKAYHSGRSSSVLITTQEWRDLKCSTHIDEAIRYELDLDTEQE